MCIRDRYEALRKGATVDEIHELTKVKHWFIEQMKELVEEEEALLAYKGNLPSDEALIAAKKDGFSSIECADRNTLWIEARVSLS